MSFPFKVTSKVDSSDGPLDREIAINSGLTVLLGPNGSGKTHILRGLKDSFSSVLNGRKTRFLSAGRIGMLEIYRSNYDGQRGNTPSYEDATFGSKSNLRYRHLSENISGDFQTLAERPDILIKIQERLRKLFKRDLLVEWDAGDLKILFSRMGNNAKPYSSGREASGLLHLVGVLAALYDNEVGALLVDEPEVSLHPQLQAFLLGEMRSVAGHPSDSTKKLVILATHSTEMVPIDSVRQLPSLVFCYDLKTNPVQIDSDAGELKNSKIKGLIARLAQEHKLALFCKRPLLVEGPSDSIVCTALSRRFNNHLEAAGSQILPVIGKGQMPVVTKLMRLLGKKPSALADADGVADGLDLVNQFVGDSDSANEFATSKGFGSASEMARIIFSKMCEMLNSRWDDIAHLAEQHPYWTSRENGTDDRARRRAGYCAVASSNPAVLEKLSDDGEWKNLGSRLRALEDLLQSEGLFILRKGTIESYYQDDAVTHTTGKPVAAAQEMELIEVEELESLRARYDEVVSCLNYASAAEAIDEAEALKDLLLALVTPAHERFKSGQDIERIGSLGRSLLGDRSKLFELKIDGDSLLVDVVSPILNLPGFPLRISRHDDVVRVVGNALNNNA